MQIVKLTSSQQTILSLLYKFRFLTVQQLQQLLGHASQSRINQWLQGLVKMKYISRSKLTDDPREPYIYMLSYKSTHLLISKKHANLSFLHGISKEKNRTKDFIKHLRAICDSYLSLSQMHKKSNIHFFGKHELQDYSYFPESLPDAYIATVHENETIRYFLEIFDTISYAKMKRKVEKYSMYAEEGSWDEEVKEGMFPTLLCILPDQKIKKRLTRFVSTLIENSFADGIKIILATHDGKSFPSWKEIVSE